MKQKSIPEQWIKQYVEELIEVAKSFDKHSKMRESALVRADAVMDMVTAYRNKDKKCTCRMDGTHGVDASGCEIHSITPGL